MAAEANAPAKESDAVAAESNTMAAETSIEARINDLSTRIGLAEVDLERYYMHYRISGSQEPKYRYLRYFLLQQAAAGCTLGSQLAGLEQNGKYLHKPNEISVPVLRNATKAGLLGAILQGSSSALELSSNTLLFCKNLLHHQDPGTARKEVASRLIAMDLPFMERDKLLLSDSLSPAAQPIFRAEGNMLKQYRNWCVYEFSDVYADVRSYQSSSNVYYSVDIASASEYCASYLVALKGYDNHPKLFGPSCIAGIVGDGLGIVSAPK